MEETRKWEPMPNAWQKLPSEIPQVETKKVDKSPWRFACVVVSILFLLAIGVTAAYIIPSERQEAYNQAINDSVENISMAYLEGVTYTAASGRIVIPQQTEQGLSFPEYNITTVCNNLNLQGGE